jgi:hypothetical protein
MLDKAVYRFLVCITDQSQKMACRVMLKIEELEEQNVQNILIKEYMRVHLQDSPPCAGKRFATAGDVQAVLEDEKVREEEQKCRFHLVGVVGFSISHGGFYCIVEVITDGRVKCHYL